jgi:hypothetical protein
MAGENNILENKINEAQNALANSFGLPLDSDGDVFVFGATRYLSLELLGNAYEKEARSEFVSEQFSAMSRSVRRMRSSYLPIDFFLNPDGSFSSDLANQVSDKESYENTFMRMLGMPHSDRLNFTESLKVVDVNDARGELKIKSFEGIERDILNERNKNKEERVIKIDRSIWNVFVEPGSIDTEFVEQRFASQVDENLGFSLEEEVRKRERRLRIDRVGEQLLSYSYLLFPPIQDSRVSRCINEPDKIVAEPFSNPRSRSTNNTKARPTLLESIIRIRLDKLSGTDTFVNTTDEDSFDVEANQDSFGALEALFILRLRSSINGIARKFIKDLDQVFEKMYTTGQVPEKKDPEGDIPDSNQDAAKYDDFLFGDSIEEGNLDLLEKQKLIEDSILALLGDNGEVLDLQSQTHRSSSVHDAHLMSGLLSVVDLPRKRIEKKIKDIKKAKEEASQAKSDPVRKAAEDVLGVDIGIGLMDMVIFSLALFTMSEEGLVGLLTDKQFEDLQNGPFKELLPTNRSQVQVAVNELSDLAYAGYKIFMKELSEDKAK